MRLRIHELIGLPQSLLVARKNTFNRNTSIALAAYHRVRFASVSDDGGIGDPCPLRKRVAGRKQMEMSLRKVPIEIKFIVPDWHHAARQVVVCPRSQLINELAECGRSAAGGVLGHWLLDADKQQRRAANDQ